jgi:hypothetical protein
MGAVAIFQDFIAPTPTAGTLLMSGWDATGHILKR